MAKVTAPNVDVMLAPAKTLAELTLANLEKVASLNIEMYNKYTTLALTQARDAFTVSDADTAKAFVEKQNAAAKDVAEGLIADSKVYAELNQAYAADVQKVVTEEFEKAGKAVAA